MTNSNLPFIIEEKETPWKEAFALLCTKCLDRLPEELKSEEILNLRSWLKNKLKEDGHWEKLRILTTGCQSYCPREGICLSWGIVNGQEPGKVWILAPTLDRESLYQALLSNLLTR